MADRTKIEWTDATVNAVNGCSVLSPGCTNCYAMRLAGTRMRTHPTRAGLTIDTKAGPVWNGQVRFHEPALLQPLRWAKPRMIFWNAHGDLFHDSVPDEWINRVFAVCALTPHHTHQILTKRSARMRDYLAMKHKHADVLDAASKMPGATTYQKVAAHIAPWPLPNVWLGVSTEDQQRANERIPDLLATPAAVRWISAEPLLGPIDLREAHLAPVKLPRIDWVVVGGESGPRARPMHPDWARSLRDQCAAAGVAFLFKQWGEWRPIGWEHSDSRVLLTAAGRVVDKADADANRDVPGRGLIEIARVGKTAAGRELDGVLHDCYPARVAA